MSQFDSTRREFLKDTGALTAAAVVGSVLSAPAVGQTTGTVFDINSQFAQFMKDIGGSAKDAGGKVTFVGADPLLRSHFRIAACMAIPAMAAGVGSAAVWRERTGQGQDLTVDLRQSIWNINPMVGLVLRQQQAAGQIPATDPIPSTMGWMPSINGLFLQAPMGLGNPLSFQFFETKDGRLMNLTGIYQHLFDRICNTLKVPPNADAVRAGVLQWNAEELDNALAANGAVAGIHRTREEWAQHPEGKYLAATPLIEIVKVGEAAPRPFTKDPARPLSGVKVLSCTHVIAGTTAARTLAEQGANVLHVARDQAFEHEALVMDVNVGMRSTFVNLRDPAQAKRFAALLPATNVFIEGFRGRAMERLGFGVEEVARQRPGIVYLSLRCYGWDGPWRDRGGFDMEGVTVSGYTMAEGGGTKPRFPPTLVLNDYIAGYLGAAGILAALRRQAKEGGSYHVRVNLTRAAMWYQNLGQFPNMDFDATLPQHRMALPDTMKRMTPYGEADRLVPQVRFSRTPGRWRDPLIAVRGSSLPVWEG